MSKGSDVVMLDTLYALVTPWAKASKTEIKKNRALGFLANIVYPLYCRIKRIPNCSVKTGHDEKVIVSLTSYPARIDKVHLCVQSLLRQTYKADKTILWLSREQFPRELDDIPLELRQLTKYGLTICFVNGDYRSYKKFIYAAQEYSDSIIVTTDDDTLYPKNWLEKLILTHKKYPDCVACYRAHYMTLDNGRARKYHEWLGLSPDMKGPDMKLVPIGVGGGAVPHGIFYREFLQC